MNDEEYMTHVFEQVEKFGAELEKRGTKVLFFIEAPEKAGFLCTGNTPGMLDSLLMELIDDQEEMSHIPILADVLEQRHAQAVERLLGNFGYPHFNENLLGVLAEPAAFKKGGLTDVLWCDPLTLRPVKTGTGYVQDGRLFIVGLDTPREQMSANGNLLPGFFYRDAVTGQSHIVDVDGRLSPRDQVTLEDQQQKDPNARNETQSPAQDEDERSPGQGDAGGV